MSIIWYAVRCEAGKEKEAAENWNHILEGKSGEAVVFTFDKMKRYEGEWHLIREPLFPGYIFLIVQESLHSQNIDRECLIPVDTEETAFLEKLGGKEHHVPMSKGYIKEGQTRVTEGPLRGWESRIRKIDRHRRLARLECPVDQYQSKGLWAGLEIVSKS